VSLSSVAFTNGNLKLYASRVLIGLASTSGIPELLLKSESLDTDELSSRGSIGTLDALSVTAGLKFAVYIPVETADTLTTLATLTRRGAVLTGQYGGQTLKGTLTIKLLKVIHTGLNGLVQSVGLLGYTLRTLSGLSAHSLHKRLKEFIPLSEQLLALIIKRLDLLTKLNNLLVIRGIPKSLKEFLRITLSSLKLCNNRVTLLDSGSKSVLSILPELVERGAYSGGSL
jgi:hypothetical protein